MAVSLSRDRRHPRSKADSKLAIQPQYSNSRPAQEGDSCMRIKYGDTRRPMLDLNASTQPASFSQVRRPLIHRSREEREHEERQLHQWDLMSIPQLHDKLRRLRMERKAYTKVADLVEYLIKVRGEKPALIHYDSLIRVNASALLGSAVAIRNLLNEMKEHTIAPDSGLFHGALQALAIHPDYVLRAEIMQEMKERWLGLSPEGWHSLVVGLVRDRQFEAAMDKLDEMHSDGITVQPWLYDIIVFQFCEIGELDQAFHLLKYRYENSMNEILPTIWYYLMDAFSSAFHYEGVKYIWKRRVETENMVLSDGMSVAILNLAARYFDPELATSAIRVLSGRRSALAAFHYEPLLAAYAGAGDLKTALRVLVIMTKAGIEIDSSTTRPLFQIISASKELAKAAWTELEGLVEDGHAIPVAAINVVLEAHSVLGEVEEAIELYKSLHELCESGPNTETFNILLQGSAKQERKSLSLFLASEMRALKIKPDMLTYDRLILACLQQEDDYEDAFKYLEELVEVGKDQPGGGWWMRRGTANLLIKRCVNQSDRRAWDLLDEMAKRGFDTFNLMDWVHQNWKGSHLEDGYGQVDPARRLAAWSYS
ncbi:uncharacterized protein RSE6_03783 [Rhynchosporium secalis]|uniref:Pentatricopeptide repeat-containing protein-mitochondrial domain-containing protein n=1 Tax=Rhynchosporium secalis TaxID=38038 RepID=A0A1E1M3M7_RHYSE|nr:uncharacterized protein RSE6_03783 [Rhynchosporium secalis]